MLALMCGRFTRYNTWADIYRLYRLTSEPSVRPRYNICPTDTIDVVVRGGDDCCLMPMRWALFRPGGKSR